MSGPDETRTQPPPPSDVVHSIGATRDFDRVAATGSFGGGAAGGGDGVSVPGYEILHEIGRGAMGVVYKARDTKLNRDAALKMILGGARADPRQLIRFLAEAESVAAIRDPNVVQVFEYGEHDGRPFLALEFLGGGTFAGRLASPVPDAAVLVGKIARGVAAAHALGIVHRDLKPENVLLTEAGEPKVTDFGLAKKAGGADLTRTGVVMGTPAYMAPEQASGGGKFVGPPADVWALGVILYECLTGRRPFHGETVGELLAAVEKTPPTAPRTITPTAPRDLELICLKCLEKNPADRYPTAKELADDLDRFARGEPVSVRPAGALERGYKWAKRKPALAGLYAFALLAVVLVAVGFAFAHLWREAEEARGKAVVSRDDAEDARQKIEIEKAKEAEQRKKAEEARDDAQKARSALAQVEYARTIDLANRVYREGNFLRARELLASCAAEHRGWEWDYLDRLVHPELVSVQTADHFRAVEFTPDGKRLITIGDEDVTVWDAVTGAKIRTLRGVATQTNGTAVSADGRRFAAAWQERDDDVEVRLGVRLWSLDTGAELAHLTAPPVTVTVPPVTVKKSAKSATIVDAFRAKAVATIPFGTTVVFDPTGKEVGLFAAGQWQQANTVRVWEVDTGKPLTGPKPLAPLPAALSHTPAGWRVLVTDVEDRPRDKTIPAKNIVVPTLTRVRVFDLAGTELAAAPLGIRVQLLRLSPDGQRVLLGGNNSVSGVLDLATGKRTPGPAGSEIGWFSPDGRRIAWRFRSYAWLPKRVESTSLWLSDADVGRTVALSGRFAADPTFSPDGRRLVTIDDAEIVRVWDTDTGRELFAFHEHSSARVPDGSGLQATRQALQRDLVEPSRFALSPDLTRIAAASPDGRLRVWDATYRPPPVPVPAPDKSVTRVLNTPSGWRVLMGYRPITIWNPDTGRADAINPRLTPTNEIAVSPNHALLATNGSDEVRVWSVETAQLLRTVAVGNRPRALAFSPDGRLLGTIDAIDNTLRVWDVATGGEVFAAAVPQNRGVGVRFSPDGTRVKFVPVPWTGIDPPPVAQKCEWDIRTKQPCEVTSGDAPNETILVGAIGRGSAPTVPTGVDIPPAVSPDGTRRVAVGVDWGVRVLGTGINQELLTLTERRGDLSAVAFSPDGRRVLVVGPGGAEVFDATPRTPVVVSLPTAPEPRVSTTPPPQPRKGTGLFPETAAALEDWKKELARPEVAPPPRPKP